MTWHNLHEMIWYDMTWHKMTRPNMMCCNVKLLRAGTLYNSSWFIGSTYWKPIYFVDANGAQPGSAHVFLVTFWYVTILFTTQSILTHTGHCQVYQGPCLPVQSELHWCPPLSPGQSKAPEQRCSVPTHNLHPQHTGRVALATHIWVW